MHYSVHVYIYHASLNPFITSKSLQWFTPCNNEEIQNTSHYIVLWNVKIKSPISKWNVNAKHESNKWMLQKNVQRKYYKQYKLEP